MEAPKVGLTTYGIGNEEKGWHKRLTGPIQIEAGWNLLEVFWGLSDLVEIHHFRVLVWKGKDTLR